MIYELCDMDDNLCTIIASYCGLTPVRWTARLIVRLLGSTNPNRLALSLARPLTELLWLSSVLTC